MPPSLSGKVKNFIMNNYNVFIHDIQRTPSYVNGKVLFDDKLNGTYPVCKGVQHDLKQSINPLFYPILLLILVATKYRS